MKDSIERISGNAFRIILTPETKDEEQIGKQRIEAYYHQALCKHLGEHVKAASITPDDDSLLRATIEIMTESGSV